MNQSKKRRLRRLGAWAIAAAMLTCAHPAAHAAGGVPDTLKLPYQVGRVYRLDLIPGSPFVVELPHGEHAANVWRNAQYWLAETTEGSGRVVIAPIATPVAR